MQPVKASGWINTELSSQERSMLIRAGITPINDIFYPLWQNNIPINLLYGGYGSGKSVFIQTDLLDKCRTNEYFKCYYGRKILEDVRGSVHSKFVTLIKDHNLESEFAYSDHPTGTMVIKHKTSGGIFLPFGANDPASLKSIDDPTHFFLEEMDQFTSKDFALILSRLRTTKANLQLYGAFNTASVFKDHWIVKTFFPELKDQSEIDESTRELIELIGEIGVNKLFCNYTDNFFIDQTDYLNKLKLTAAGDKDYLDAIANGAWGTIKAARPFAHQYNQTKHESKLAVFDPKRQLIISIDFNIDPFGVIFAQTWRDEHGEHLHVVDEMSISNGSIPEMVDRIKAVYGAFLQSCVITGDAMGRNRNITDRDNLSNYDQLCKGLGVKIGSQLKLPGANPRHSNSRADVNYLLAYHPDIKINSTKCPNLSRDMRLVEVDMYGEIKKKDRTKEEQLADHLDCFRYLVNTFFVDWITRHMRENGIKTR